MTITTSITPARPAAPVQPDSLGPVAIVARTHPHASQRTAEAAQAQLGTPLPSLTSALARRKAIFGPVDLSEGADIMSGEPANVDPIFAAITELDQAADSFALAWMEWTKCLAIFDPSGTADWGDGAEIVCRRLGPTAGPALLAYRTLEAAMNAAAEADTAAQAAFMATTPTSELGRAAYRAAARRYADRVTGCAVDEEVMRARLAS